MQFILEKSSNSSFELVLNRTDLENLIRKYVIENVPLQGSVGHIDVRFERNLKDNNLQANVAVFPYDERSPSIPPSTSNESKVS